MTQPPVLQIENLRTYFYSRSKAAFIRSVDGVDLEIGSGETLGVVGESGSGKSITALSVLGLVSGAPGVITGKVGFRSPRMQKNLLQDLAEFVSLDERDGRIMGVQKKGPAWQRQVERVLSKVRGREISMIFQDPKASLNPFLPIGEQIAEAVRIGCGVRSKGEARERALHWLEQVRIDSPRLRYDNHPYGLSGGMCQRAMIAMALAAEPTLLIADEPTTGLDATIQARIVDLLAELRSSLAITTLLISHDIEVIRRLSDRVAVMYGGRVMESGPAKAVLGEGDDGRHPYTEALLASVPSEVQIREKGALQAIEGEVLDTINIPRGCRFQGRCRSMTEGVRGRCLEEEPELFEVTPGHRVRCWLREGR